MKCWHCNTELIWQNDHTDDDDDTYMITYLECPKCPTRVEVYHQTVEDTKVRQAQLTNDKTKRQNEGGVKKYLDLVAT